MLRKIIFIIPVFVVIQFFSASPALAITQSCSLYNPQYTDCYEGSDAALACGDTLQLFSNNCTGPTRDTSAATGSYCCNPAGTTPVPTIIPSCIANGNYCIPGGESCDPGHVRGQGGSCEVGKVCCSVPLPTRPPPGGPPLPIPLPTYPTNFTPLEYPCYTTTDEEFHPLRPYPASPCDPLIPAKSEPWPLSFACGKSLNPQGEYKFPLSVNVDNLDEWNETTAQPGTLYRCGTDVCTTKRSVYDISLDLSPAKLPVVGNTQDPLDDAQKANNYLSWYLAGTNPFWIDDISGPPPADSSNLSADIAQFFSAGANAYLLWQYSGDQFDPLGADQYSFYRGSATCSLLDSLANQYTPQGKLIGVNIHSLANRPADQIRDHLTYLKNDCGTSVVRIWGTPDRGGAAGVQKVLDVASEPGVDMKIIVAVADYANTTDPILPDIRGNPTSWYAGGYVGTGYLAYAQEISNVADNYANLYALELANEPHCGGHEECVTPYVTWAREVSASLTAPRIGIGQMASQNTTRGDSPGVGSPSDYQRSNNASRLTHSSAHYYNATERANALLALTQARTLGKTFYLGEAGFGPLDSPGQIAATNSDPDRFLTYASPLKKLLPQSALDIVRYALKGNVNWNVHNYALDTENRRLSQIPSGKQWSPESLWASLFQRVPLATMEDTVGEVTIGLVTSTRSDGTSPQPPDVYVTDPNSPNAMRLTIRNADSRLYFPHLKTVGALIDILNAISRPRNIFNYYPGGTVGQRIDFHQGITDTTRVTQITDGVQVFDEGGFSSGPPLERTRNTEVIPNHSAPVALFGQTNHFEFDQRCDLTTLQAGEGDNLFGSEITGRLTYTQKFRYTPLPAPPAGSGCLTQDPVCASGSCNTCNMGDRPDLPSVCPGYGQCNWRYGDNTVYCEPGAETHCGSYANITTGDITLPTEARVGVFTKTPLIDAFYENLITAKNSFFRRFVPAYPTPAPGAPDLTIKSGALTFPVKTQVGYDATNIPPNELGPNESNADNPRAGAGNNTGGAEIYFPRLGSLVGYFLGSPTDERLNFQKMLRPKDFTSVIVPGSDNILSACRPYVFNFPGTILVNNTDNPNDVFAKIGDSITVSNDFLNPFGSGNYNLGRNTGLSSAVSAFTVGSYTRPSLAACVAWNSGQLLSAPRCDYDNGYINRECAGYDNAISCELDKNKSASAIIMIGTNDSGGGNVVDVPGYTQRLNGIVDQVVARGTIPILTTLPHLLTGDQPNANTQLLSEAIKNVANTRGIPYIDYRKATEDLIGYPLYGISIDNIHPSTFGSSAGDLTDASLAVGGYNVRNFVTMCALDAIWKTRLGGGGSSDGDCFTAATPVNVGSCSTPGRTPLNFACHTNTELRTIIEEASNKFGVNPSVLFGVLSIETRNGVFGVTSGEIRRHATSHSQTGFTPYICQPNSCGAMGAMQLLTGIGVQPSCSQAYGINNWAIYGSAVVEACKAPNGYGPNPGNIRDSIYAGAKMIGSFGQDSYSQAGVHEIGRRYFGNDTSRFDLFVNLDYINDCVTGYTTPPSARSMTYGEYLWEVARPR